MIYSKKANFPFPILTNNSFDYNDAEFEFDVTLSDNTDNYIFDISYTISSNFINELLRSKKARLILIIKSKDNQFHLLKSLINPSIIIPKSRLSLSERTVLQLMIQTTDNITFSSNNDLTEFYTDLKNDIQINKGMALGFSNLVTFNGKTNKQYDLFERKVDPSIPSDIDIRIGEETILIVYKNENMQFSGMSGSNELNYPYIYIGLQKALISFVSHYTNHIDDSLDLSEVGELSSSLDEKLYQLMTAKKIDELSLNNMDHVIYLISDKLISRFTNTIRGMHNGN